MPSLLFLVIAGAAAVALLFYWGVTAQSRKHLAREQALTRMGFSPCPDREAWLEETVTGIENNREYRYEVRDPKCLSGTSPVYYYIKRRYHHGHEDSYVEEEILFALKRPSAAGLVLVVKPSSLAPGLATRMLGTIATGPWDAQPDDLQRLELPMDLRNTNLVGALGPPGASLYDLVDSPTLGVIQGLGDVGGMFVRFRDAWCVVASTSKQIPFRADEVVSRIRPLL